jgi:hypothetical protein
MCYSDKCCDKVRYLILNQDETRGLQVCEWTLVGSFTFLKLEVIDVLSQNNCANVPQSWELDKK